MVIKIDEYLKKYIEYYEKEVIIDYVCPKENILFSLRNFCKNPIDKYYIYAWEIILMHIPEKFLENNILDFLIENKIGLEILCCKELSNEILIKIYLMKKNLIEALITIGKRMFLNDEYSIDEFKVFLLSYNNPALFDYLLKYIIIIFINSMQNKLFNDKSYVLIDISLQNNNLIDLATHSKIFLDIINEKSISKLKFYYNENDALSLLALSLNNATPIELLKKMITIKNTLYSKLIRKNSLSQLKVLQNNKSNK